MPKFDRFTVKHGWHKKQTLPFEASDRSHSPLLVQNWSEKSDKSLAYLPKIARHLGEYRRSYFLCFGFKGVRMSVILDTAELEKLF